MRIFSREWLSFLSTFYKRLAEHPDIELTAISECLAEEVTVKPLDKMMAGS